AHVIETIRGGASARNARVAIFDFDGTLSLIRCGWRDIMIPLCVGQLAALGTGESEAALAEVAGEFVWRLTGKETIYQMMALADAVRERGGEPLEPRVYKRMYLDRLWLLIRSRIDDLRAGRVPPEAYLVPGSRQILESLHSRGIRLFLASGTDHADVNEEARLLGLDGFFGDRIFGAQDDPNSFSKALLVQQLVSRAGFRAEELLVFGDGYVEIEEVKKAGGVAVGVATAEPDCRVIDGWKRGRLIQVGADFIVPNFLDCEALANTLFAAPVLA
ncbi:MAG: HAD family hydrolase, partial [Bryobacteraceae bacterium]